MFWRPLITCFIIIGLCFSVQAGYPEIDSLKKLVESKGLADSERVETYLSLRTAYTRVNFDTAIFYNERALTLADQIDYQPGKAKALRMLADLQVYTGSIASAEENAKKALLLFRKLEDAQGIGKVYHSFARISSYHSAFTDAVAFCDTALFWLEKADFKMGIGDVHLELGLLYYRMEDYPKALEHYDEAKQIFLEINDIPSVGLIINNKSLIYSYLGMNQEAIQDYYQALEIFETTNDLRGYGSVLSNIGELEYEIGNYDEAKRILLEAIEILSDFGNLENVFPAYQNMGANYAALHQYDSAIYYYRLAKTIATGMNRLDELSKSFDGLGMAFFDINKYDSSMFYLQKSLEYRERHGSPRKLLKGYLHLGQLYATLGRDALAEDNFRSALQMADSTQTQDAHEGLYRVLYEYYKQRSRPTLALYYNEKYIEAKENYMSEEENKQIIVQNIRYQASKKDQEIQLQKIQLEVQSTKLRQQATQRNFLLAGILSLLVISGLIFYTYRNRQKAKELVLHTLKETEQLRSRFFTSISHEFRTPLTLIAAPIDELLKKGKMDEETNWALQLVKRNTDRLKKLVSQVLDLSRLEVGKLKLQVVKSDVISWIRVIASSFDSLASSKDIQYVCDYSQQSFVTYFDSEKLEQVVTNLLSNAFKFTPIDGLIELKVKVMDGRLEISVSNSGSTIPSEDLERIFDRFYQSESSQKIDGTGIGLALVKELVELHHGSVKVKSSKGHSTVFSVFLPTGDEVYKSDLQSDSVVNGTIKPKLVKQDNEVVELPAQVDVDEELPSILIVEDNQDLRDYIVSKLSAQYAVSEARNGEEGLELAKRQIPELIIADVMMPKMDGLEMLSHLREDQKTSHIPIVLLTAKADKKSRMEGIGTGADHYLSKPFELDELKIRIQNILIQQKRVRDHYKNQFLIDPQEETIESIDDVFIRKAAAIVEEEIANHEFSVEQFSKEIGMSRAQLHRKIRAIIGYSPSEFIRTYRLKKAYEYLKNRKGSVSEIAYSVGFNNLSYFTKSFKELFEMNPSELLAENEVTKKA